MSNIQLEPLQFNELLEALDSLNDPEWLQWIQIISIAIAIITLVFSIIINRQGIERYKNENIKRFETEYNDYLYSINYLFEIRTTLANLIQESELEKGVQNEKIRNEIYKTCVEIAYLQGNETDYAGGIVTADNREWRKIPLKYVNQIHLFSNNIDKFSRKRYEMNSDELVETANLIIKDLDLLFRDLQVHIHIQ